MKDAWLLGDNFITEIVHAFSGMNAAAKGNNAPPAPYLYQFYNITCLHENLLASNRNILSRLVNALIRVAAVTNFDFRCHMFNNRGMDIFWMELDRKIETFDYGKKEEFRPSASAHAGSQDANYTQSMHVQPFHRSTGTHSQQQQRSAPTATVSALKYINARY